MKTRVVPDGIPSHRFPVEPWALVETEHSAEDLGVTETLFAQGNGYLGMRANPDEGREAHSHGTFLNGFHETWEIQHAEAAFGFARTGQTIVNVPDAKVIKLYVDDEPLLVPVADLDQYERRLDFRAGTMVRELVWRTPSGKLVRVRSERIVSVEDRHLAMIVFEVEMLEGSAPIVLSSQLLNRQDGQDEYHVRDAALGEGRDPRKTRQFAERVLQPVLQREQDGDLVLGYRCTNSGMTLAAGIHHDFESEDDHRVRVDLAEDLARMVWTIDATPGHTSRLVKYVSYHTSKGVPPRELANRCQRTLERAGRKGPDQVRSDQRTWFDSFWLGADVEVDGDASVQQAIRWNLFQLAQASARCHEQGIAAKGVTGSGYEGHYFWDTEVYVVPFLAYCEPQAARKLLRFRWQMLGAARKRAHDLSQDGALYPWRTINGEEASAYYAAGTAQYHINAAVVYALRRYLDATGDGGFLAGEGAEILVETARLWEDLGFWSANGERAFHIHGVTGPDEYTTVVNNNLYTNAMARFNLRYAADTVDFLAAAHPEAYSALCRRLDLTHAELDRWREAADGMYLPYDDRLGIHPQDDVFLARERWPFDATPDDKYPLLLNFHPLVIYRHQVLKQADVVLAMFLRAEDFDDDVKRRNFAYYDPITTGDSSLSACVQAIVAADTGNHDLALRYFHEALYVDLADTHGNASDGVHIASAGGVWNGIVFGFAGMRDDGDALSFRPRLPSAWQRLAFHLTRHGSLCRVELRPDGASFEVLAGDPVKVRVAGEVRAVEVGDVVPLGEAVS